ncbi:MAG: sulfatase-like hydrolase/transferase [Thermogutta sp.]
MSQRLTGVQRFSHKWWLLTIAVLTTLIEYGAYREAYPIELPNPSSGSTIEVSCEPALAVGMSQRTRQTVAESAVNERFSQTRPNILWLTLEDVNCHLGCYGDAYADTPNIDRLAAEGVRFTHAIAGASVCTPCRSTLITGMYAVTLGSQHLRSPIRLAKEIHCFPELLRKAGYYCTNNVKQDYNFECPPGVWDESSARAHWRNRPQGRPFFAVFNTMVTHQSRVRMSDEEFAKETASLEPFARHDPQTVPLPPYLPDTPGTRKEMARYYDMISAADSWVGQHLRELKEAGLEEDTIIFVFGDNGAGIPRHKRALYDSGVRVPLIIYFPKRYEHFAPVSPGQVCSRVVSFVDFAPTVLKLAGVEIPQTMQGCSFLESPSAQWRNSAFLFRDRVDEVFEMSRGVRTQRFKYIRNFMPHRPYMEISEYCEPAAMVRDLRRLAAEGQLVGPVSLYLRQTKPIEELYDLENDPHELNNLANNPRYEETLASMREELRRYVLSVRDTGFLPEGEMFRRGGKKTIWEMAQSDREYPLARIYEVADLVGRPTKQYNDFAVFLSDSEPAVRYWGVIGLMSLGAMPDSAISQLHTLLKDDAPEVRIAAAEALCRINKAEKAVMVLAKDLHSADVYVRLYAASTLAVIGPHAAPAKDSIMKILGESGQGDMWMFTQWALARCCRQLSWPIPEHSPTLY